MARRLSNLCSQAPVVKTSRHGGEWGRHWDEASSRVPAHAHQSWGGEPLRGVRLPPLLPHCPHCWSLSLACPLLSLPLCRAHSPGSSSWVSRAGWRPQAFLQWLQASSGHSSLSTSHSPPHSFPCCHQPLAPPQTPQGRGRGPWYLLAGRHSGKVTQGAAVPTRGVSLQKEHKAYPSSLLRLSGDRC